MEPRPPHAYQEFIQRYPKVAQAWELIAEAGAEGPLDAKTRRLLKLAIAIGAATAAISGAAASQLAGSTLFPGGGSAQRCGEAHRVAFADTTLRRAISQFSEISGGAMLVVNAVF